MQINFTKYHGTGNDFIMLDGLNGEYSPDMFSQEIISQLCHRHFGIGADGLIILAPHHKYNFEMIYYNSDGRRATMCGNGGRCILHFAHAFGHVGNEVEFWAADGYHAGKITDQVSLKMADVSNVIKLGDAEYSLDTGSPHYVAFRDDVDTLDIVYQAHKVRYSNKFKEVGINVNFVARANKEQLTMRTYERGVEDETFSCGTGVVATAIAHNIHSGNDAEHSQISTQITTKGGILHVKFKREKDSFTDIWLTGPAKSVFSGILDIKADIDSIA